MVLEQRGVRRRFRYADEEILGKYGVIAREMD